MRSVRSLWLLSVAMVATSLAAPRQHTVAFGRWRAVKVANADGHYESARVRALFIDGRLREYTSGAVHLVTNRILVIRGARRINDSLPDEAGQSPRWVWQLDSWLSVDRLTGHIAELRLPVFDPESSRVNWYRDYAAYCGSSDDGSRKYMVVFQLGNRKPILKKEFSGAICPAPRWQRDPSRVTFDTAGEKNEFLVRSRNAEPEQLTDTGEGPQ